MAIPMSLRREVRERAEERCEYCGLAAAAQEAAFHIDHIIPVVAGGLTNLDNLALACVSCSLRKGARLEAPDPQSGKVEVLFHPRFDSWRRHFLWEGERVIGLSPTGRATIAALNMNRPLILAIRREETMRGRHPPPL
jgi:hypothetical protein